jgi:hypothetical protein
LAKTSWQRSHTHTQCNCDRKPNSDSDTGTNSNSYAHTHCYAESDADTEIRANAKNPSYSCAAALDLITRPAAVFLAEVGQFSDQWWGRLTCRSRRQSPVRNGPAASADWQDLSFSGVGDSCVTFFAKVESLGSSCAEKFCLPFLERPAQYP